MVCRHPLDRNDRELSSDFADDLGSPEVELADCYAGELNPDKRPLSGRQFVEREVGDCVGLGSIELIVREIDDERRIAWAGLASIRKG